MLFIPNFSLLIPNFHTFVICYLLIAHLKRGERVKASYATVSPQVVLPLASFAPSRLCEREFWSGLFLKFMMLRPAHFAGFSEKCLSWRKLSLIIYP